MLEVDLCSDAGVRYLTFAEKVKGLSDTQRYYLLKAVEHDFIEECDTPLGDFLNDYVLLMLQNLNGQGFAEQLEQLFEEHDLNQEMLECVADSLESMLQ
jgi:hypothetical protein